MSAVATECAGRGLGCAVVVCDFFDERVGHEDLVNGGKRRQVLI